VLTNNLATLLPTTVQTTDVIGNYDSPERSSVILSDTLTMADEQALTETTLEASPTRTTALALSTSWTSVLAVNKLSGSCGKEIRLFDFRHYSGKTLSDKVLLFCLVLVTLLFSACLATFPFTSPIVKQFYIIGCFVLNGVTSLSGNHCAEKHLLYIFEVMPNFRSRNSVESQD
jgi:hypothetical protein